MKNQSKNILLINNEFAPIGGGGSNITRYKIKYLVQAGYNVVLITSRYKNLPHRETIDGAKVIRVPTIRRYANYCSPWELVIFGVSALFYVFIYSFKHKIDLIQAYFAVPAGWVAWNMYILRRIPYVIYFGGSDVPGANPSRFKKIYPFLTPLLKVIWRPAKARIVCSEGLLQLASNIDRNYKFEVIPNGIELERFKPIIRPENNIINILFVGRLIPHKGVQHIIEALPTIRRCSKHEFRFTIIGGGKFLEELNILARQLDVSDLISFVNFVPYDDIHKHYQQADIFTLMSHSEGLPSVVLEAMASALPVVVSNVRGNSELVREGDNGFKIPLNQPLKLSNKLCLLINNTQKRKKMGLVGREMASNYGWRKIVNQYQQKYQVILRQNS